MGRDTRKITSFELNNSLNSAQDIRKLFTFHTTFRQFETVENRKENSREKTLRTFHKQFQRRAESCKFFH